MVYLAHVIDFGKGEVRMENLFIVREFPDEFLEELSGLPLEREVEVSIDVLFGISLIAQAPYKMALVLVKLIELKIQLQ
jgi:hypothetical protein